MLRGGLSPLWAEGGGRGPTTSRGDRSWPLRAARDTARVSLLRAGGDRCRGEARQSARRDCHVIRPFLPRESCQARRRAPGAAVGLQDVAGVSQLRPVPLWGDGQRADGTISRSEKRSRGSRNRSSWRKITGRRGSCRQGVREGFSEEVSSERRPGQWDDSG